MSENEILDYIVESIEGCDRLKHEYLNKPGEHSKEMSKIFEGMSEAYCDIYEKLSGESYGTPLKKVAKPSQGVDPVIAAIRESQKLIEKSHKISIDGIRYE